MFSFLSPSNKTLSIILRARQVKKKREMSNTQDATSSSPSMLVAYDYLAVLYAVLAIVAFVQLIRIQSRNPIVWTTQKSFVVLNFFVMSIRATVFGIRGKLDEIEPKVFASVLLDLPGLIFFTTCTSSSSSSSSSFSNKISPFLFLALFFFLSPR